MLHRALTADPAALNPAPAMPRRLPRSEAPGSRDRDYWVHVPRRRLVRRLSGRPAVLMVLHGCRQDATDLMRASRFIELSAPADTVVVFPSVTSWRPFPPRTRNCWGYWMPAERRRDEGEVGDLRRIFAAVEAEFGTDPARRYIAGLSSGGAMAVAMAVVYGDAIRAAGSVAGLAFGETGAAVTPAAPTPGLCPWFLGEAAQHPPLLLRSFDGLVRDMAEAQEQSGAARPVPLMVIQSTMDRVVRAENARMLRDVWIARGGGDPEAVRRLGTGPVEHDRWVDRRGDALVETVFFEGRGTDPTHYWPGDHHHPPFAHSAGPSASQMLLEFFRQNGL